MLLELRGIDVVGVSLNVHEHRAHLVVEYYVAGGDERHRWHEDLVVVFPTIDLFQRANSDVQRASAAVAEEGVARLVDVCEHPLETLGEGPVRQAVAGDN